MSARIHYPTRIGANFINSKQQLRTIVQSNLAALISRSKQTIPLETIKRITLLILKEKPELKRQQGDIEYYLNRNNKIKDLVCFYANSPYAPMAEAAAARKLSSMFSYSGKHFIAHARNAEISLRELKGTKLNYFFPVELAGDTVRKYIESASEHPITVNNDSYIICATTKRSQADTALLSALTSQQFIKHIIHAPSVPTIEAPNERDTALLEEVKRLFAYGIQNTATLMLEHQATLSSLNKAAAHNRNNANGIELINSIIINTRLPGVSEDIADSVREAVELQTSPNNPLLEYITTANLNADWEIKELLLTSKQNLYTAIERLTPALKQLAAISDPSGAADYLLNKTLAEGFTKQQLMHALKACESFGYQGAFDITLLKLFAETDIELRIAIITYLLSEMQALDKLTLTKVIEKRLLNQLVEIKCTLFTHISEMTPYLKTISAISAEYSKSVR